MTIIDIFYNMFYYFIYSYLKFVAVLYLIGLFTFLFLQAF